ncbi:hypothetical protein SLEP1_g11036 [Rubroshorea leprosula]|uniref:Glycosyltransferase N-terminal domain-containing protein n=1 Tax=Rubroshorea leprosula TaxID=152421 RepID=A0AAV5IA04_9ROSI|nr:hypothetical protein SLEP1_g11036 [Rubroshorea leprosula]
MGSVTDSHKPHAVCVPFPAQGHVNPMMKLAKLLHFKGLHITFVNTEFNHQRLLKSRGPNALDGLPDFRYETIPDGLPPPEIEGTQDIPALCDSTSKNCLAPFRELLARLNSSEGCPSVTCIISDGVMSFTLDAAEELGIPGVLLWTTSACGFLGYVHYASLIDRGLFPLKDESDLTNGYLDMVADWIPGMKNMIRLRDLPTFIRTTDRDDFMVYFLKRESERARRASAIVLNTFDQLEHDVLVDLASSLPPVYTIGPLHLLVNQIPQSPLSSIGTNLWKDEPECLHWLNSKDPKSVVYVNFGSITVVTAQQLVEFAWGLANSKQSFLWIIRPDLVRGDSAVLPPEFLEETKDRSMMVSWCPQEQVLKHPAVGGFLMHSGWNSTIESISFSVPMICWSFFAEQPTNCRYACIEWGNGMEIDSNVKRDEVEKLVRELMEGIKGGEMRKKAAEWKRKAEEAACPDGSSFLNLDKMINEVLLKKKETNSS